MKKTLIRSYYARQGSLVGIEKEEFIKKLYRETPSKEEILADMGLESNGSLTLENKFQMIELTSEGNWNGVEQLLGVKGRPSSMSVQEYEDWKVPAYEVKERTLNESEEKFLDSLAYAIADGQIVKTKDGVGFREFFQAKIKQSNALTPRLKEEDILELQSKMPQIITGSVEMQEDFIAVGKKFCAKDFVKEDAVKFVGEIMPRHLAWRDYYVNARDYKEIKKYASRMFIGDEFFKLIPLAKKMGTTMERALGKLGWKCPNLVDFYMTNNYVAYIDLNNVANVSNKHSNGKHIKMSFMTLQYLHQHDLINEIVWSDNPSIEPYLNNSGTSVSSIENMIKNAGGR